MREFYLFEEGKGLMWLNVIQAKFNVKQDCWPAVTLTVISGWPVDLCRGTWILQLGF